MGYMQSKLVFTYWQCYTLVILNQVSQGCKVLFCPFTRVTEVHSCICHFENKLFDMQDTKKIVLIVVHKLPWQKNKNKKSVYSMFINRLHACQKYKHLSRYVVNTHLCSYVCEHTHVLICV